MSGGGAYLRFELRRTFRNRRFLFFSLGFPIALYFLIAGPNRGESDFAGSGIAAPLYYMVALAGFGTMMGMVSTGTRIAGERQVGWTRQLRVTPLSSRAYLRAKVLTAYALAGVSVAALYLAGAALGVSIPPGRWIEMTLLIAVALLPFAALGIFLGHLLNVDAIGPATGGTVTILAFIGGTWFPVTGESCTRSASASRPTGSSRRRTSRSAAMPGGRRAGAWWSAGRWRWPSPRAGRTGATPCGRKQESPLRQPTNARRSAQAPR